ncbi:MAG: Bifunctional hemolysin/adenylate cyclase precursor [Planctomycetes bacterium ADurb.Bin126]|nr:MAG: Bifunctional hemolysin/adenylate cyclase precursor [Planctomycetes bacterium ADurb.Bin126]HOD83027.1 C2 family cysteine protease [Phycisphaerae bacterium]HQL71560.1 C2 family cysteine protease [Phycisphaerae bacterium]
MRNLRNNTKRQAGGNDKGFLAQARVQPAEGPVAERLEERIFMSAGDAMQVVGDTLYVYGTIKADSVVVQADAWGRLQSVTVNGETRSCGTPLSDTRPGLPAVWRTTVKKVAIFGYDGNDEIRIEGAMPGSIEGGDGADLIVGGSAADSIWGGEGNDKISGMGGNDTIRGESGDDVLYGGAGHDLLWGGEGSDQLHGGDGCDRLDGGGGDDRLWGDDGVDGLYGQGGDDQLFGGAGNDHLNGHAGDDVLHGEAGADTLLGGDDQDLLLGGDGNDSLLGGDGADELHGGEGNDRLDAGDGNDELHGDGGSDSLLGGGGDDSLYGGAGSDWLYGGSGNDTLVSIDDALNDVLYGQGDFDSFWVDSLKLPFGHCSENVMDASAAEKATNLHKVAGFANGADRTLDGDDIADPTDGANYKNFAGITLFAEAGPSADDIDQGQVGDCWLMASMGAVAQTDPNAIRQTVVSLGDGTYAVRLGGENYYRVDGDLPTRTRASGTPTYAGFGVRGCLWPAIVEKAYAHYRRGANTYASLGSGSATEAFKGLNQSGIGFRDLDSFNWFSVSDAAQSMIMLSCIASKLDSGHAVCVIIEQAAAASQLIEGHAYGVASVDLAAGTITLRNPWGPAGSAGAYVTLSGQTLHDCSGDIQWCDLA